MKGLRNKQWWWLHNIVNVTNAIELYKWLKGQKLRHIYFTTKFFKAKKKPSYIPGLLCAGWVTLGKSPNSGEPCCFSVNGDGIAQGTASVWRPHEITNVIQKRPLETANVSVNVSCYHSAVLPGCCTWAHDSYLWSALQVCGSLCSPHGLQPDSSDERIFFLPSFPGWSTDSIRFHHRAQL